MCWRVLFCRVFFLMVLLAPAVGLQAKTLEFGRYDVLATSGFADCIDQPCSINFQESYTTPPLVFLMDTVEFRNEDDQPSSLVILNVTRESVTFQQQLPPSRRNTNPNLTPRPMRLIDYLVIEKGVHRLNDETMLIAESVSTRKYQYRLTTQNNAHRGQWETIRFAQIPGAGNFPAGVIPGVLHQVQTRNNAAARYADFWLTSTVQGVSNQTFEIALERSEVDGLWGQKQRPYPTVAEEIGYVAAYGSGTLNGRRFQMGSQQTTNSIGKGDPVTIGCDTYAHFGPFQSIPILIANKNSRQGNNGGWVRRCRMEPDKASFMIDEDMDTDAERGHVAERVGYFLFEKPFEVQTCDYFNSAVQTWKLADGVIDHEGRLSMSGNAAIYGAAPGRQVGFLPNRVVFNGNSGCPSGGCSGNADLMLAKKPEFTPFTPAAGNVIAPKNNRVVLAPGNYSEVKLSGRDELVLSGGEYWIGSLKVSGQASIEVIRKSVLNVNSASISGANVRVNYRNGQPGNPGDLYIIQQAPNGEIALSGGIISAYLVSHYSVSMSGIVYVNGAVTTKYLSMSGNAQIHGDLDGCGQPPVSRRLVITPQTAYGLTCERMPIKFEVQKADGTIDTGFVGNMQVSPDSDPDGALCWAATPNGICEPGSTSIPMSGGERWLYLQSQNVGDIQVSAQLTTEQGNTLQATGGPYRFAPFGFRINGGAPAAMIAGKPLNLKVEAVASQGASCEVIQDYGKAVGEAKTLTVHSLRYVRPTTQNMTPEIADQSLRPGQSHETQLRFQNGVATLPMQYFDAGELQFKLQDLAWQPQQCGGDSCEDHQGDWQGLFGTAVIYARPYTFALCDIQSAAGNTDFSGTSGDENSPGFARAGERFSVTVKPLAYPDFAHSSGNYTGDGPGELLTAQARWCRTRVTPNYYQVSRQALDAPLALSVADKPHTPSNGQRGELTGSLVQQYQSPAQAKQGLVIDNLRWSEVGSLWLKADGRYLGSDISPGVGAIGRFYPAAFVLETSAVKNAYGSFTYMEQAFSTAFSVEARNIQGEPTRNYGLFSPALKAKLALVATDQAPAVFQPNDLTDRLAGPSRWQDWQQATLSVPDAALVFKRKWLKPGTLEQPGISEPDGPYMTDIGLVVMPRDDCTHRGCADFASLDLTVYDSQGMPDKEGTKLSGTVDARYGRMTLEDVTGRSDSEIAVPLRVEYWDGREFVTNVDDSASWFDGKHYCKQIVSQSMNLNSESKTLEGHHQVRFGQAVNGWLTAFPHQLKQNGEAPVVYYLEQVRFWQKLVNHQPDKVASTDQEITCESGFAGPQPQPWLLYNWRGKGDENPSARVTFGAYRGNDRVIYRGEKGINILLN
ncbi:DUF6701 domain-containing protein [Photobacterium sp. TY1-4]|uniref:DUF6701 domain-containing protein n=1 Tax=Photobacterium sp. TY1-4 TaxID=2899122 RepID=UPI0021BFEC74|nr:DUF6701 domain-containing protein [Photobacterium sp. TY1-4]UXI01597.1 hypothetical protein NH461_01655 [Photobacterium sp. TY1-4]